MTEARVPNGVPELQEVRSVLADHFVMRHALGDGDGPRGEWRCACGAKFGFSDTAIDHVAALVLAQTTLARVVAAARDAAQMSTKEIVARIHEFDASDDYHRDDHQEPGYYAALDRVVRLLRGEITDWLSPK